MDTFNQLLDEIIPHSFVTPEIYNEFITLSILRYRYIISREISEQISLSKTEQKRQLAELSRKTTFFCIEVNKCVYDKIDIFDKISKDQIIHAIISYFNDIIPNSNFYFENIKNDNDSSFGGRENEYMLFSYKQFPQLYLNINNVSFISDLKYLNTIFNSYIDNYEVLYNFLAKRPAFTDKSVSLIKEMFENNNLSIDNINIIIDGIIEFINNNIVVILNNGKFLMNKPLSLSKTTIFVYLQINEGVSNYWSIIKSYNLNDKSINNYTINDVKINIINKMIDNCFNSNSLSLIPDEEDFSTALPKIEIEVDSKKIILLVGKTGILYKTVTNEILGIIELIDGNFIADKTGVCNIQWVSGYNELL